MARPSGEKTRCSGQWTEARFKSFIKSLLRQGTRRWGPIQEVMKDSRISRGLYKCAECGGAHPPTYKNGTKRSKNVFVDHIDPIIDPSKGFTTWDECIDRMFCEVDNLQVLCKDCHDIKTAKERDVATLRKKKEKEQL